MCAMFGPLQSHARAPEHPYLSQLLGKPILDAQGDRIARLHDLVVRFGSQPHPVVSGLIARQGRRDFFLPWSQVAEITPAGIRLGTFKVDLRPFARRPGEALLRRDILDKQLIDVDGRRVIRANDLRLARVDGDYRLVAVDVSAQGLLRRLGPAALVGDLEGRQLIDWADVESFATDVPMVRLRTPHAGLRKLHPVDIARIVEAVSYPQRQEIIASLDDETAADTVQELAPDDAAGLMERLDPERAADILDEMEPNDAADLLADLPEAHAETLLERMEPDEAADVRELLAYEGDTAAGLMTTEFVALPPETTAGAALAFIRALEEAPNPLYHVYLVGPEDRWLGVASLRDIVLAPPKTPLSAIEMPDYQAATKDEDPRAVAHTMAEYNLSDMPVLDDEGRLLGIILVDDAMDVLHPDLWRRRIANALR
jgi:magnesium transporter